MRKRSIILIFAALFAAAGEDPGARVRYVGGTVPALAANAEGRLDLTGVESIWLRLDRTALEVPYGKVNVLEYGQKVNRRIAEAIIISPFMLLAKKRQHFLTVGFTDRYGRQQAMVFRVGKGEVRSILVALEVKTGRKIEYQDEDARRAGKG